jgi:HlyB family type I secretion system ABC transporter
MNSFPLLRVQGEHNYIDNAFSPTPYVTILHLLRLVALDTNLAWEFSQAWTVREFQLGDKLTGYVADATSNSGNVSLVCEGKVRLLGFDATLGREVSLKLLSSGDIFGADSLFCPSMFSYRASASCAAKVAQITVSDLQEWLLRLPNLELYLRQLVEIRQKLIFLKTVTLQSSQVLQDLLPYFLKIEIKAGTSLIEATPASIGRFWLVQGTIGNANTVPVTQIGHSWGYPHMTQPIGIAQTDLVVYYLPSESCELISTDVDTNINRVNAGTDTNTKLSVSTISTFNDGREAPTWGPRNDGRGDPAPTWGPRNDGRGDPAPTWGPRNDGRGDPAPTYPFIEQQSSSDCGATCLAMVCMYWGKRISVNTLRNLVQTDRMGASLLHLVDGAENLGYEAVGVRASLNVLESQTNPWIAHWQGVHYVVVWCVQGELVVISDPAMGKRTLSRDEFESNWTGYALTLTPTERLQTFESEKISLGKVWHNFWHYRRLLAQILLASVVLQVFGLVTPLIASVVIDKVMPLKGFVTLNILAVLFLLFGIWRILVRAVRQYLLDYLSNHMDMTLVSSFIRHALQLPLQFFASRQVGDILSRVEENRKIQVFLTRRLVSVTLDAVFALLGWGLIAYYNLQLTLVVLGLTIPAALLTLNMSPSLKRVSRSTAQQTASQNAALIETISQITTVKIAACEQWMLERWEERFAKMIQVRFRGQRLTNNLQLINNLINHLGSTAVLWYGSILVMQEQLTLGKFVALNMLIGSVINPILGLVELRNEYQEVLVSMERLNDVLETQPEATLLLQVLPQLRGEVRFENVTFSYHSSEGNALQNINFSVQPGQTIGIVGASGAGKTTVVNLLAGLYRPQQGRILIDGYDIAGVSPQSLRSQLGIVPTDTFLFAGTILENITLFNRQLTIDDARTVAKIADIHSFIESLPHGYDTQVGMHLRMFSAGQKQQIGLARALIRNPRILIFDEATSSLSSQTGANLQQNLIHKGFNCTTFIITHRLATLHHADRILVLNQGIIAEQGNYQELIAINGLYSRLIQQHGYM